MQAVEVMGNAMARSGMFGITKPEQGTVLALHAMLTGKSVVDLAAQYHIIEGRLTMRADAMQAAFQDDTGRIKWMKSDTEECVAIFTHSEFAPEGVTIKVTLEELKRTGVAMGAGNKLKSNYQRSPRQMLRARCVSEGVRMVDPRVIVGLYTPEEVQDFEPSRQHYSETPAALLREKELDYTDFIPEANETEAIAFLRYHGWISASQGLADLTQAHLKNIEAKPAAFLEEAKKHYTASDSDGTE